MDLMVLVGLLFMVFTLLVAASPDSSNSEQQDVYIFRGLAIAFVAVGVFSIGVWLSRLSVVNMLDVSSVALSSWILGIPLAFMFLFGLNGGRKIQ